MGGLSHSELADICVRADWPRKAGIIQRRGNDYFWQGAQADDRRILIANGKPLPISGSASLTMHQTSPLSNAAIVKLRPPHRFNEHVDGVVLVEDTLLVGPQPDCQIRCHQLDDRAVLTRRGERWMGKAAATNEFEELKPGNRTMLRSLAMTLEKA